MARTGNTSIKVFLLVTIVVLFALIVSSPYVQNLRKNASIAVDYTLLTMYTNKLNGIDVHARRGAYLDHPCEKAKHASEPCVDTKCNTSIAEPPIALAQLLASKRKIADKYLTVINNMATDEDNGDIVFVTAASANHYREVAAMFKTLHENILPVLKFRRVKIIVYDIGLNTNQRQTMEKYCKCNVKNFPFSSFPKFVQNIRSYIWKPIMIQAHLHRSDILMWLDASVRFLPGDGILIALAQVYHYGIIVFTGHSSMAQHAHSQLTEYFGETHCPFSRYREIIGTVLMFHNERFVQEAIVDSWLACGFYEKCMATTQPAKNWGCDGGIRKYGKCHRFDQSAIGLIVVKLFQTKVENLIGPPLLTISKTDKTKYFPGNY